MAEVSAGAVSVVVPAYNGAAFLGDALHSALAQARPPSEIVVVDDASTDGSAALVELIARSAPLPVRLIRLAENSGGPARPINVGVGAATGGLIAVLDQDDVVTPGWLAGLSAALGSRPGASFACCTCGRLDPPHELAAGGLAIRALRRLLATPHPGSDFLVLPGPASIRLLLAFGNYAVGFPGLLFRKADWLRKGGLDERLRISSDYDFMCWLSLQGPALFVPRKLYLRRVHGSNLSLSGVRPWVELAQIASHYLRLARPPAEDRVFWRQFRAHLLRMLPGLGLANRHGDAFRLLGSITTAWGVHAEAFSVFTHLLYTLMARHVYRRGTASDPGPSAALVAELEGIVDLCRRRSSPRRATARLDPR